MASVRNKFGERMPWPVDSFARHRRRRTICLEDRPLRNRRTDQVELSVLVQKKLLASSEVLRRNSNSCRATALVPDLVVTKTVRPRACRIVGRVVVGEHFELLDRIDRGQNADTHLRSTRCYLCRPATNRCCWRASRQPRGKRNHARRLLSWGRR